MLLTMMTTIMMTNTKARKEDSMNTNRFISNKETFDNKPLQDVKFGGAIITGYDPENVGGISTKAEMDRCPYNVEDWERDTYVSVFTSSRNRFNEGNNLRLHLNDIPNLIGLLQKTYDDFSALNNEVVEALKITCDKSDD